MSDAIEQQPVKDNSRPWLEQYKFKPGQTGNPQGRKPMGGYDRDTLYKTCKEHGYDPIKEMIRIAREKNATPYLQFEVAKEIASYLYPKQKAVQIKADSEAPVIRIQWDDGDTAKQALNAVGEAVIDAVIGDDDLESQ